MTLCAQSECPVELGALVDAFGEPLPIVSTDSSRVVGAVVALQLVHGTVADVATVMIDSSELKSGARLAPVYLDGRLARLEVIGQLSDPFANVRSPNGGRWICAAARRYARRKTYCMRYLRAGPFVGF